MIALETLPLPVGTSLVPGGVQHLSLRLERGGTLWVTGPAEAGKTALLDTIALRRPATGGMMTLLNHAAGPGLSARGRRQLQQRIGYIEAAPLFMDRLTLADNIALPLELNHLRRADVKRETDSIIRWFGLESHAQLLPHSLSQTMRMRAACARALITQPSIVLVDEPALTLCPVLRDHLLSTLRGLARNGTTTLLAMQHQPEGTDPDDQLLTLPRLPPSPEASISSASGNDLAAPLILSPRDERLLP
ncbi:MAG: ATP-binding cassette domain-containing protein [Bombella sp.]|nr:ATP-binding cassette domain-containing protein [Bombella sp.]